jgi:dephospho-CoA kinase
VAVLRIALTGNVASGKSTVADVWRGEGAKVIDADVLARRAVEPGTPALDRIVAEWGPGMLLPSGELDRVALRDVVFRDAMERNKLEKIIHPEVDRLRRVEEEEARREGRPMVVSEIPLLFEAGVESHFDIVVLVDSPERVREDRLVAARGLSREEARRMISAQWSSHRKRDKVDYIIDNLGDRDDLERQARSVWSRLRARAASGP